MSREAMPVVRLMDTGAPRGERNWYYVTVYGKEVFGSFVESKAAEVLTALRAALAAEAAAAKCNRCGSSTAMQCNGVGCFGLEGQDEAAAPKGEVVGWMDEFGNVYPLGAWKPRQATYHDDHKHVWKPLYAAQPPTEAVRHHITQPAASPACFGVMCDDHGQCARYAAIEAMPSTPHVIATCQVGETRPMFVQKHTA